MADKNCHALSAVEVIYHSLLMTMQICRKWCNCLNVGMRALWQKHLKNGNKSQTIQILNQNKLKDPHFICMYKAV